MTKKRFDCVAMKRKGSERVFEAVNAMTVKEEVAFWRERTAEFRRENQARKKAKADAQIAVGRS